MKDFVDVNIKELLIAVYNIFNLWKVTEEDKKKLLNGFEIKPDTSLIVTDDIYTRLELIYLIFGALQILFEDNKQADDWINKSNKVFEGKSALEVMIDEDLDGMKKVNMYLYGEINN